MTRTSKAKGIFLLITILGTVWSAAAQERPDALKEFNRGEYGRAVEICLEELEGNPGNMDSYTVLGWSLLKLRRYREALESSNKALGIRPSDIRIIAIAGEASYYLGKNLDALNYFEKYAALAPSQEGIERAYFYMGEIFIRLGEYNRADIAFTTAVHHSSYSAKWWSRLGYAREMAGDFSHSLEAYAKALELNSSYSEALRGRERVERKLENP